MKLHQIIFFLILSIFALGQNKTLEKQWQSIDNGFQMGKYASLLPQIATLKNDANKLNAYDDYIKALFYESKIKLLTTDQSEDVNFIFEDFAKTKDGKSKIKEAVYKGDTYFPPYEDWHLVSSREPITTEDGITFQYFIYEK